MSAPQHRLTVRPPRFRGERAVTIIMTALVLVPLMVFAAYGVDLAGFYSRVSQLQRAADAAALAGTVWMPDFGRASSEAAQSLAKNGFVHGQDGIVVEYSPGSRLNSFMVEIEDTSVTTYFSNVIGHRQAIARSAEAQYNLPLPLGSPLNYFGGDRTRTEIPGYSTYEIVWPPNWNDSVSVTGPLNVGPFRCNVGTVQAQGYGGWRGTTDYRSGDWNTSGVQCRWTTRTSTGQAVVSQTPPNPGHFMAQPPTSSGTCYVDSNGTASGGDVWGRWSGGVWSTSTSTSGISRCTWGPSANPPNALPDNASQCRVRLAGTTVGRYQSSSFSMTTSGTGGWANCQWTISPAVQSTIPSSVPPFYGNGAAPAIAPLNRPCNVGIEASWGQWIGAAWQSGVTAGRPLCEWHAQIDETIVPPANPIDPSRSPGFWAAVEGPNTRAVQGDAYSTRCWTSSGCTSSSTAQNQMYQPESDLERGYWYVVKVPNGGSGVIDINVFDGAHNPGATDAFAGDRNLDGSGMFPTRFTVYKQNHELDFRQRSMVNDSVTGAACQVTLTNDADWTRQWNRLCSVQAQSGDLFQINVQTTGTTGAGVNGYALEAVRNGSHANPLQPALYAYNAMQMQNNNLCSPTPCTPPRATFYIAEVGPQYAGKTLVMELWDPGDVGSGVTARMWPMMPSGAAPKPIVNVPFGDCQYSSDRGPNSSISEASSSISLRGSDTSGTPTTACRIVTSSSGTSRFNGNWLRIRINVPEDYTCTPGINPETTAGSCWWGIQYEFTGSANDVTTWQARIEGNPVHLTE